jgi:hypothetical protein
MGLGLDLGVAVGSRADYLYSRASYRIRGDGLLIMLMRIVEGISESRTSSVAPPHGWPSATACYAVSPALVGSLGFILRFCWAPLD